LTESTGCDPPDGRDCAAARSRKAPVAEQSCVITYVDAKGDETTRMITPLRVQAANQLVYLVAYCHLRQAERSFRLDRIVDIGEIE
jgi:predicted DNA-binding transcriptional regulator YafY